ncbi:MAG: tannase/feruloyl esterase family alpha/beta hydrolase [Aeromonas sp.]
MNQTQRALTMATAGWLLSCGSATASAANGLSIISPVKTCEALLQQDVSAWVDGAVTLRQATLQSTDQGDFCQVKGTIAPAIGFEVSLPLTRWTQRYLQLGCGGLCGDVRLNVGQAHHCAPARRGEFVVAATDMGHQGSMMDASWGKDPQKRIDFAYRAQHQTAQIAKGLIQAFYGQAPRYTYFMGCSDGGREALVSAQRYPADFDGISAGAPAAFFSFQNGLFHSWNAKINVDKQGKAILLKEHLPLLHQAVLAHCPTLSGVADGMLNNPYACKFDPAWVKRCDPADKMQHQCLTDAQIEVAKAFYAGPHDSEGNQFSLGGMPLGSELSWPLPSAPDQPSMSISMALPALEYVLLPEKATPIKNLADFTINQASFNDVAKLAPLYNGANTNLAPFMARGGKLILWHGLADESVTPAFSLAYYQGVLTQLGQAKTDQFMRLFLLPGVGHCGRGDGFGQLDLLTPLLAWTEHNLPPAQIIADKVNAVTPPMPSMPPMPPMPPMRPMSPMPPMPESPAAMGLAAHDAGTPAAGSQNKQAQQFHVMGAPSSPLAEPGKPVLASRPLYPYPFMARYKGQGDVNKAGSYEAVAMDYRAFKVGMPARQWVGPDNQKQYHVVNGVLVVTAP